MSDSEVTQAYTALQEQLREEITNKIRKSMAQTMLDIDEILEKYRIEPNDK